MSTLSQQHDELPLVVLVAILGAGFYCHAFVLKFRARRRHGEKEKERNQEIPGEKESSFQRRKPKESNGSRKSIRTS